MDSSRFDAWTRRAFGLAAGGAAAAALGLHRLAPAAAKKKRKKKKNKKKGLRSECQQLRLPCQPRGPQRCCPGFACEAVAGLSGLRCCQGYQATCTDDSECCGTTHCEDVDGLPPGGHCCVGPGTFCESDNDCCGGASCNAHFCGD